MQREANIDLQWWIAVIGVPLVGTIFAAIWGVYIIGSNARAAIVENQESMRKEFYDYKVQVAIQYATISFAKDIELRTMTALTRIEDKLDRLIDRRRNENGGERR